MPVNLPVVVGAGVAFVLLMVGLAACGWALAGVWLRRHKHELALRRVGVMKDWAEGCKILLTDMTPKERMEFLDRVVSPWCLKCGRPDHPEWHHEA